MRDCAPIVKLPRCPTLISFSSVFVMIYSFVFVVCNFFQGIATPTNVKDVLDVKGEV